MIRVALILGKYNIGGRRSLTMNYFRNMNNDKVRFDFICDSDSQAIPYEEIEARGGRVFIIRPYQNIFGNIADMKKLFRENKYSIVHAYNSTMNVFPMYAAKVAGVPVRISESISMGNKQDKKTILKNILKTTSRFFANYYMSCGTACGVWQFGQKALDEGKLSVFKSCIDTEAFDFDPALREEVRKEYGWEDKIVIGHVGRMTKAKNPVRMMDMFAAVLMKEPSAVFCYVGDGELQDQVFAEADKLGIRDKVYFVGGREDVHRFYCAMDGFLLPSLYEGIPNVGLEAQSGGLPVFFSTEVPEESAGCEICRFIPLSESDSHWADVILDGVKENMPVRRGYTKELASMGFDSKKEAKRLQQFYFDVYEKECGSAPW
jgi:glycosyltransferase involved in cell wall biosynthesis